MIIDLDNVRIVEVYDDYTEPHLEQLKHVRFVHMDGSIIDVVAAKVAGLPDDVAPPKPPEIALPPFSRKRRPETRRDDNE